MYASVAIIIVNWNGWQDTLSCLDSISSLAYSNYHVFLVDNHSSDKSYESLNHHIIAEHKYSFPITIMQTEENLGFAGGNNFAIRKAVQEGFDFFWMLNNDTVVDCNSLTFLCDQLKTDPTIGIVGSKIYYYNSKKIWFAGGLVNTWTGKSTHLGYMKDDSSKYSDFRQVDYITGCSLMFRKEVLEQIGYMREDYFLYYEETDWNLRAHKEGWKIVYVPDSHIYHKVSIASGGEKNLAPYVAYYDIRNAYWLIKRTQGGPKVITAYLFKYIKAAKKILKIYLFNQNKKSERIQYILKGLFGF